MDRGEAKQFVMERAEQGAKLGSFVLQRIPVVGLRVQHFFDQDSLLNRLLHHEGVKHLEQVTAELEVAKVCGPEHVAAELRLESARLAAELRHDSEHEAEILPFVPKQSDK